MFYLHITTASGDYFHAARSWQELPSPGELETALHAWLSRKRYMKKIHYELVDEREGTITAGECQAEAITIH